MSEAKSEVEYVIKTGRQIVEKKQVDHPEQLNTQLDAVKQLYNELGAQVRVQQHAAQLIIKPQPTSEFFTLWSIIRTVINSLQLVALYLKALISQIFMRLWCLNIFETFYDSLIYKYLASVKIVYSAVSCECCNVYRWRRVRRVSNRRWSWRRNSRRSRPVCVSLLQTSTKNSQSVKCPLLPKILKTSSSGQRSETFRFSDEKSNSTLTEGLLSLIIVHRQQIAVHI